MPRRKGPHKKKPTRISRLIRDAGFNRNLVSDYTRNVNNYLQTATGPNAPPIGIIKKGADGPKYADGTPMRAYWSPRGNQTYIDPTWEKYESDDALPNTGLLMNTLGHELGHQRSEYQLGTNAKTMTYLNEFAKVQPPDAGKLAELQRVMDLRRGYRPLGNLPDSPGWNPGSLTHSQPLERYAMDYGNALFKGGIDELSKLTKQSRYGLMDGGLESGSMESLQAQGVLPRGKINARAVDARSRRDALMGSKYSKERRRVQRAINAVRPPRIRSGSGRQYVPLSTTTSTSTTIPPTNITTSRMNIDLQRFLDSLPK